MSAELQSTLRFQAARLAAGQLAAEEFAALARSYLELERSAKLACASERGSRAAVKARLKVLPGNRAQ